MPVSADSLYDAVRLFQSRDDWKPHRKKQLKELCRGLLRDILGDERKTKPFTADELNLLRCHRKLECVKSVKGRLNLSLIEAKRYVEEKGRERREILGGGSILYRYDVLEE